MVSDDSEGTVPVDLHNRAAVRLRRRTCRRARHPWALRERVETATAAKFHVDEQAGAGGHFRGGGRLRPAGLELNNLAVLGKVGDRAGLGHVHRIARHHQAGRDDVVERDQHGDLAVAADPQHAIEVPVSDQETAPVGLQRVLEPAVGGDRKLDGRRIVQVELANVRDDGETVWAVHSIDAVNVAAVDVRADQGDQYVRGLADERDVDRPTNADGLDRFRQTAGERRDLSGLRIDARDPASCTFGDVQRTIGADGAAYGTLQARG